MKSFKGLFILGVTIVSLIFVSVPSKADALDAFYENAVAYGFNISKNYKPIFLWGPNLDSSGQEDVKVQIRKRVIENKINEKTENATTIIDMLLYNVFDPSIYCYAYKVISEPKQPGRNWGFLGIGSYGDDFIQDYVKVSIAFPKNYEIMSYTPVNDPGSWTSSIGVGVSNDGFEISASVNFNHSELNVISHTSTNDAYYEALYDFNCGETITEYLLYEVASFGMVLFKANTEANFEVNYDIHYQSINGYEERCASAQRTNIVHRAI